MYTAETKILNTKFFKCPFLSKLPKSISALAIKIKMLPFMVSIVINIF